MKRDRIHSEHVGKNHIHLHMSCSSELAPSKITQYVKGRSPRIIQQDFSHLRKRYWGKHLWACGCFCPTDERVTEKMIRAYIDQQEIAQSKDVFSVEDE
jgi:putative transposase